MPSDVLHLASSQFFQNGFPFAARRIRAERVSPLWHDHEFFELVVVVEGHGVHKTLGMKTRLSPGAVYYLNRGEAHSFEVEGRLENLTFMFTPELLAQFLPLSQAFEGPLAAFAAGRSGGHHHLELGRSGLAALRPVAEAIHSECSLQRSGWRPLALCDFLKLLLLLRRHGAGAEQASPGKPVARVLAWLQEHYREEVTLDGLAKAVELNPSYLSHLFRRETGFRLTEFVNDLRIRQATELLRHSELGVLEIAQETGFRTLSVFYETFRRATGLAPLAVRRMGREPKKSGTGGKKTGS